MPTQQQNAGQQRRQTAQHGTNVLRGGPVSHRTGTPAPDQQRGGNHLGQREQPELQQIQRGKHPHQRQFQAEDVRHERARPLPAVRLRVQHNEQGQVQHNEQGQQRRQRQKQHADAIDADVVTEPREDLDPLHELHPRRVRLKPGDQLHRQHQLHARRRQAQCERGPRIARAKIGDDSE